MRHIRFGTTVFAAGWVLAAAVGGSTALAAEVPATVSPGSSSQLVQTSDICPTFSWTGAPGTGRYELVIYRVGEVEGESTEVLRQKLPGGANSWTPSLDLCLQRGGRYAWSVRAAGRKGASDWSPPRVFEVTPGPTEAEFEAALELMRQYLAEEAIENPEASDSRRTRGTGSSPIAPGASAAPAPLAAAPAGDSALQVNGSPVVTVATLTGALCSTTELRFLDLGDGTVLDCNTGSQWLKDASCMGSWPYEDGANPNIFDKVSDLNNGLDFDCADYTPGTYTHWEVPDVLALCSKDPPGGICPATNAPDSLVDSSVSSPTVRNASGDGVWMADDAFAGVQSLVYWSATEGTNSTVGWAVLLTNGQFDGNLKTNLNLLWPVRAKQ